MPLRDPAAAVSRAARSDGETLRALKNGRKTTVEKSGVFAEVLWRNCGKRFSPYRRNGGVIHSAHDTQTHIQRRETVEADRENHAERRRGWRQRSHKARAETDRFSEQPEAIPKGALGRSKTDYGERSPDQGKRFTLPLGFKSSTHSD